eukprot:TRINITY_DN845_c0_g1_i1.p1 TRINITY_DN845_c0_g1~~TRINITY_DN845_c0_g1_i1.p1  ORF type:complete len:1859 (+),score=311.04 TRINITY_DN845_c0_g1_i1:51-5627(+)
MYTEAVRRHLQSDSPWSCHSKFTKITSTSSVCRVVQMGSARHRLIWIGMIALVGCVIAQTVMNDGQAVVGTFSPSTPTTFTAAIPTNCDALNVVLQWQGQSGAFAINAQWPVYPGSRSFSNSSGSTIQATFAYPTPGWWNLTVMCQLSSCNTISFYFIVTMPAPQCNLSLGFCYEAISAPAGTSWIQAATAAQWRLYNGLTGYLATVSSSAEASYLFGSVFSTTAICPLSQSACWFWLGGTAGSSCAWQSGPDTGLLMSCGSDGPPQTAQPFGLWCSGYPQTGSATPVAWDPFKPPLATGCWQNNVAVSGVAGYVVKYGLASSGPSITNGFFETTLAPSQQINFPVDPAVQPLVALTGSGASSLFLQASMGGPPSANNVYPTGNSSSAGASLQIVSPVGPASTLWFAGVYNPTAQPAHFTIAADQPPPPPPRLISCTSPFGHCYELVTVSGGVTWQAALSAASQKSYNGMTGYLATLVNKEEAKVYGQFGVCPSPSCTIWIGASAAPTTGFTWAAGPEVGSALYTASNAGTSQPSLFNGWCSQTPPQPSAGMAVLYNSGATVPCWQAMSVNTMAYAFLVEYGASFVGPLLVDGQTVSGTVPAAAFASFPVQIVSPNASALLLQVFCSQASTCVSLSVSINGSTLSTQSMATVTVAPVGNSSLLTFSLPPVGRLYATLQNTAVTPLAYQFYMSAPAPACDGIYSHCYELVLSSDVSWQQASTLASLRNYNGVPGYLATITSSTEAALLASLVPVPCSGGVCPLWTAAMQMNGVWTWAQGPEAGTQLPPSAAQQDASWAQPYNAWCSNFPLQQGSLAAAWVSSCMQNSVNVRVYGFVVEYGSSIIAPDMGNSQAFAATVNANQWLLAVVPVNNPVLSVQASVQWQGAPTDLTVSVCWGSTPAAPSCFMAASSSVGSSSQATAIFPSVPAFLGQFGLGVYGNAGPRAFTVTVSKIGNATCNAAGRCFEYVDRASSPWSSIAARAAVRVNGYSSSSPTGFLAQPSTAADWATIAQMLPAGATVWLGGEQSATEGYWRWAGTGALAGEVMDGACDSFSQFCSPPVALQQNLYLTAKAGVGCWLTQGTVTGYVVEYGVPAVSSSTCPSTQCKINSVCSDCPAGSYNGSPNSCTPCSGGTASNAIGASSASTCTTCAIGTYAAPGSSQCSTCAAGGYCPSIGDWSPVLCAGGTYSAAAGATSSSVCAACNAGTYCNAGATAPSTCPAGSFCPPQCADPQQCAGGSYSAAAASGCSTCPAGNYCPAGASTPTQCNAGWYANTTACSNCTICPAGWMCGGSGTVSPTLCPANTYAGAGTAACISCPLMATTQGLTGSTSVQQCVCGALLVNTPGSDGKFSCQPGGGLIAIIVIASLLAIIGISIMVRFLDRRVGTVKEFLYKILTEKTDEAEYGRGAMVMDIFFLIIGFVLAIMEIRGDLNLLAQVGSDPSFASLDLSLETGAIRLYVGVFIVLSLVNMSANICGILIASRISAPETDLQMHSLATSLNSNITSPQDPEVRLVARLRYTDRRLRNALKWLASTLQFGKLLILSSINNKLLVNVVAAMADRSALQFDMFTTIASMCLAVFVFVVFTHFDNWVSRIKGVLLLLVPLLLAATQPICQFVTAYFTQKAMIVAFGVHPLPIPFINLAFTSALLSVFVMVMILVLLPVVFPDDPVRAFAQGRPLHEPLTSTDQLSSKLLQKVGRLERLARLLKRADIVLNTLSKASVIHLLLLVVCSILLVVTFAVTVLLLALLSNIIPTAAYVAVVAMIVPGFGVGLLLFHVFKPLYADWQKRREEARALAAEQAPADKQMMVIVGIRKSGTTAAYGSSDATASSTAQPLLSEGYPVEYDGRPYVAPTVTLQ